MRREPPVRIREGLGVQFPRATRLIRTQFAACGQPYSKNTPESLYHLFAEKSEEGVRLFDGDAAKDDKDAARFAAMRLKYSRAARHPWLSVPPDPLPPK